ncbi:hypothetical protein GC163_21190 [bacterium]|nr:hypothetical protein [bacterium]
MCCEVVMVCCCENAVSPTLSVECEVDDVPETTFTIGLTSGGTGGAGTWEGSGTILGESVTLRLDCGMGPGGACLWIVTLYCPSQPGGLTLVLEDSSCDPFLIQAVQNSDALFPCFSGREVRFYIT